MDQVPFSRSLQAGVNLSIHPQDEMLAFLLAAHDGDRDQALLAYFSSGERLLKAFGQVVSWRFGGWGGVGKLLDFASGYGRVTRHLVRELLPERIWIAEILPEAVAFQRSTFGVNALASSGRPADFEPGERFDAIFVTSLFTHLPRATFAAWLEQLAGLLSPGGVLAFSTHDLSLLPSGTVAEGQDLLFQPVSEIDALSTEEYGSTWVSEGFVRGVVTERLGAEFSCHRIPRGLLNHQDLYLLVREPGCDFAGLTFAGEPEGYLEACAISPAGDLRLSGWVANPWWPAAVERVEVWIDGELAAIQTCFGPRADVAAAFGAEPERASGWEVSCPCPAGSRSAVKIAVRAVGAGGFERLLHASSLESALLWSAKRHIEVQGRHLAHAGSELARLEAERAALERHIAWMRQSPFWRLRERCVALARRLGFGRNRSTAAG